MHWPDQVGTRRIGQLGDYLDQLTVKITGLLLVVMCPVRDKRGARGASKPRVPQPVSYAR